PRVKYSGLDRVDYQTDYQPDANAHVLAAFALIGGSLADGAGGVPPVVLDIEALRTDLSGIQRDLAGHVNNYLDFWTDDVPNAMVPRKPDDLSWGQFRRVVTQDEREIAGVVREMSDLMHTAIGHAEGFLGKRGGARAFKSAMDAELAGRVQLDDARGAMLDTWARLPADPGTAGDQLVTAADRDNFLDRYFPLHTDDQPGVCASERLYWSRFAELGLTTLTHDASGETAERIREAEGLARRFPLTLDASRGNELTGTDLSKYVDVTRGWDLTVGENTEADAPYANYPEQIALSLISLRGDSTLGAGGLAGRLDRAKRVADFLIKYSGKIECTLASLGYLYEPNAGTREFCRQLSVSGRDTEKFDENAKLKRALSWDLPLDRGLDFQFKDLDGNDTASARLSPWEPLASLGSPSIDKRDVVDADSDIWPLPVVVTHSGGSGVFWIGVQFEHADGLEDLREGWLRQSDWSRE
ncbi:MAG: hypothetical protein K8E66_07570, partial [Phycisphaerales bacterium]|nr:hypothetical protein [Phycisphaerales bacterium]